MSQTLDQIFVANPSTSMAGTDLLYLVHSPYSPGSDSAILYSNLGTSTPTASQIARYDANSNLSANNPIAGYATTVTAAGTTTLTVASKYQQYFTGSTTQIVAMPVTSTLVTGQGWLLVNNSSGNVTVNSSGGNLIQTMAPGTRLILTCILTSGTTSASWSAVYSTLAAATQNPGIAIVGTPINSYMFSFSIISQYLNGVFNPYVLSANITTTTLDNNITSIDMGAVVSFDFTSWTQTWTALTSFTANSLVSISLSWNPVFPVLTSLSLPALTYCAAGFTPTLALCTSVSLPNLISVGGTLNPSVASLTTLSLPALTTIGSAFNVSGINLTTFSAASLSYIGTTFSPTLASLTTLTLTSLATIGTAVAPIFASLVTLSLPALVSVGTTFTITAANMTTFSMGSTLRSLGGNFTMTGMKLNQASVDGILVSLAALDGTGGTTAYSSKTINLSGGTSSTPSATGLAAKATLVARGCTVTTN